MAYRFKRRQPLSSEVRRIADTQLAAAVASLDAIGTHAQDEAVHAARRHVKKVRALLQLVKRPLGPFYEPAHRQLDRAIGILASIADAEELVDLCNKAWAAALPSTTRGALQRGLRGREARIDRQAQSARALPQAAVLLRRVQAEAQSWRLGATGFRAVAYGFTRSVRRVHTSRRRAEEEPTVAHMRRWRRRIKDLWYQLRLMERRCVGRLAADMRRLEQLDGILGEYHNLRMLEDVLVSERLLTRIQTREALRLLRRAHHGLARRAKTLGDAFARESAPMFIRRVRQAWMAEGRRRRSQTWQHRAA